MTYPMWRVLHVWVNPGNLINSQVTRQQAGISIQYIGHNLWNDKQNIQLHNLPNTEILHLGANFNNPGKTSDYICLISDALNSWFQETIKHELQKRKHIHQNKQNTVIYNICYLLIRQLQLVVDCWHFVSQCCDSVKSYVASPCNPKTNHSNIDISYVASPCNPKTNHSNIVICIC